jgi:hypothetical protein
MALTKAQVSLVSVATLGVAPGGFTADLMAFNTQDEAAAFIESAGLLSTGTNAEYVLQVMSNLGTTATAAEKTAFFSALEGGTSRAEATVDFANGQLVANGKIANVDKATASTSTSTDLTALKAELAAADTSLKVSFADTDTNQQSGSTADAVNIYNVGKAEIDAGQSKTSADYTFELKNQIDEKDTFNGLFLSPILERQAAESSGSQLFLELLDLRASTDGKDPLERVPVDTFAFSLDGSQILVQSDAIFAATTYAQLFAAIQARVAELGNGVNVPTTNSDGSPADAAAYAKLANFTVELGNTFTVTNQSGEDVSGTQIVLTDAGGATLTPQGFVNKAGVIPDPGYTLYAQLDNVAPTTVTKLITTNLEADNVGYGSQGATVNLAGQSASDKGVEEIKVTATNGVWFTALKSKATTDHLERIELQTGSNGYFRVGTQKNSDTHVVALVDQDFTAGGLVDVQQVEAGAAGSTAINSWISDSVLSRYELKDTGIYTADDSQAAITYNLTSGQDVLNLAIDTDVLEAVDTKVNVSTGAGDDVITVMASKGLTTNKAVALQETSANAGWLVNQQLNDNVTIDAGAGNDWVLTPGSGNAIINAGSGNDVVRVDNAGDRGVLVFNNATTDITKLSTNQDITSNSDDVLSNGANDVAQTYNFFKAQVQVSFKGFESDFVTIDSTNYQTTTLQINQAIKAAVNNDPVLSKLLFAIDNEGNALAIESLIDGLLATNELVIDIISPVAYNATETAADKAIREADSGNLMLASDDLTKADTALKVAAGTTTTAAMDTAVGTAEGLYASEFGTTSTGTNTTTTVATTTAGTQEVQTIDFAGLTVDAAGNGDITVGGVTVTLADSDNDAAIAGKVQAALNGQPLTAPASGGNVVAAVVGTVVTITYPTTSGDITTNAALANTNATFSAGTLPATATETTGKNAADEVQTLDFSNIATNLAAGSTLTFTSADLAGSPITYTTTAANETPAQIAAGVQAEINGDANASATVAGNVVTVTFDGAAVQKTDTTEIVVGGTGAGANNLVSTNVTGGVSGAESDNVVNLGSGQDVLTLGTGALSNDTIKIDGYGLGEKSIVNFTAGAVADTNGGDLLDFSSYLVSVDATTKATVAKTVNGTALSVDNSVSIVDFNTGTALEIADSAVTFESLTAANVLAMINGTEDANNEFGNLHINAVSGTTGKVDNFVLLVHDNAVGGGAENNEGTYKAFHVTSAGGSTDVASVQLIGTFDFGEDAAGNSYLDSLATANLA